MRLLGLALILPVVCAFGQARVHVSIAGKRPAAVAGRPWTVRLAVRPSSFRGPVKVTAKGTKRVRARVTRVRGAYRARLDFPSAGRWRLTAQAGGTTSRLGAILVRRPPAVPVMFVQPTSIELEPSGTLLLVENNPGRLLSVEPATGRVTVLVPSMARPFAVVRAPSGSTFVSAGSRVVRIDAGAATTVVQAAGDIGPLAAAPNGDLYFATATQVFRLAGGAGPAVPVGGSAQFSAPHGLAVAADGSLLVADTGDDRIRRIDPASGAVTDWAQVGTPDGLDVAADGTVYVVEAQSERVVHLSATGARLGFVGPAFATPYDVEAAPGGAIFVLEAGSLGFVRRVAPNGTVTTISRRR
jgi:streptogramin lyase